VGTTRSEALESARLLVELLSDEHGSTERILAGYLEAKARLSVWMYQLAVEQVKPAVDRLEEVKAEVEKRMALYADRIPEQYLRIRGFGRTHALIYAMLWLNQGKPVTADRLRVLTADAVHTERRTRELRELGLTIDAAQPGGQDAYLLRSRTPDVDAGAREQVRQNLMEAKNLPADQRQALIAKL
jgi:hypothetical protein